MKKLLLALVLTPSIALGVTLNGTECGTLKMTMEGTDVKVSCTPTATTPPIVEQPPVVAPPAPPPVVEQPTPTACPANTICIGRNYWTGPQEKYWLIGHEQKLAIKVPYPTKKAGLISTAGVAESHATRIMKLSTIPGDLKQDADNYCYAAGFEAVSLRWTTEDNFPKWYCKLDPDKQYYLNIGHTPNCMTGVRCGFYLAM